MGLNRTLRVFLGCLALLPAAGCVGSMKPGQMAWVQTTSDRPRAGNVYLVRGLIGLFSFGIDRMTNEINDAGIRANVFQQDQHNDLSKTIADAYAKDPNHEPICLIGHSCGANNVMEISRDLEKQGIVIDMLVTMDATEAQVVPANVKVCYNYYQSSIMDFTGVLRGVAVKQESDSTKLFNYNIRKERSDLLEWDTTHVNVDKNQKIHKEVIGHLLEVCPVRADWLALRNAKTPTTMAVVRVDGNPANSPTTAPASQQSAVKIP